MPVNPAGPTTTTGLVNINDASVALDLSKGVQKSVCYVFGAGTVSGGTILVEEAPTPDYAGTWGIISTIVASTLNGACQPVHIDAAVIGFRVRVSSAITGGGSVSTRFLGL